jgi:hypothetical protein
MISLEDQIRITKVIMTHNDDIVSDDLDFGFPEMSQSTHGR